MTEVEIYESPKRESNIEKHGEHTEQCICCGRMMTDDKPKFWIHATTNWMAIDYDATEEQLSAEGLESQGAYMVGATCAKRFPKTHIKQQ